MKDDKFEMGTGQAHELAMAFGRNGWTNADVKKLSESDMLFKVLSVVRGYSELKPLWEPSRTFALDLIPDGWLLVEDVAPSTTLDISKLKRRSFLKNLETDISGEEMRKRAVKFNCNLGLCDGKRMLAEQNKIHADFREFFILLPGTVLRNPDDRLSIPILQFNSSGSWYMYFRWLDYSWQNDGCLASSE